MKKIVTDIYVGIDPSYANTGVIVLDDSEVILDRFCCKSAISKAGLEAHRPVDLMDAMIDELNHLKKTLDKKTKIHVMIEYPMKTIRIGASSKVNESFAACAIAVKKVFGFEARICYPIQWKPSLGAGTHQAMKSITPFVERVYRQKFENDDLCAAYGVARYLRARVQREKRL